jgi:hypothetical protein
MGDYPIYRELGSGTFKAGQTKATVPICTMSYYYTSLVPSIEDYEWINGSSVSFNPDEV